MQDTKLFVVVPCYNEEEVIKDSAEQLLSKLHELISQNRISDKSVILFVNDGSKDATKTMLLELCEAHSECACINFMKNYGHQSAILAGMLFAKDYADAVITIDADLQQDINAMADFVEAYDKGADVVYGVRNDRKTDGPLKRWTATLFYGLMHWLGVNIIANSADYRLLSKKAVIALDGYKETALFLRGLIPFMGLPSDVVYFDVKERQKGKSKYTFSKMLNLALDGITSFSIKPLHIILTVGVIMICFAILMILYSIIDYFVGNPVAGYTTMVISIWLVGGILMLSMGVIGEYIGKIYQESKKRPRYVIESCIFRTDSRESQ
jgi:glycosyltransferase involved in cell wall biosynthesis